jgi:hypothetical protein
VHLHRTQVVAARDQRDVGAAAVERSADVGADRAGADNRVTHLDRLLGDGRSYDP